MSRLLIVSCSRRKRPGPEPLPAIERYDGPAFRVLRRFLRQRPSEPPDIYVLSARFGLIPGSRLIPDYDQRMTARRARELQTGVGADLAAVLKAKRYRELFILVGREYRATLDGYTTLIPGECSIKEAAGTIGKKLAELHDWLYGEHPMPQERSARPDQREKVCLRGVEVSATAELVGDLVRQALALGRPEATRYQSWYVPVDGQRIAPKWLVGQLSGLPVSSFVTDEARRVLAQLGIEVRRA